MSGTTAIQLSPARPAEGGAERVDLTLPGLPGCLESRSVLHLSDLHVRRYRPWFRRLIELVARERPDFCFLTGDYMTLPGDELPALDVMHDLIAVVQAPLGVFGCFGNHDTEAFKRMARQIPGIRWLEHEAAYLPDLGITLLGTSTPGDVMLVARRANAVEERARQSGLNVPHKPYRILLGHEPSVLITAAEVGIEWMLGGHTHGGQVRLWFRYAPHNSSGLPGSLSSGILRCRDSICTISRGLGESYFDFRLMCPPQIPRYHLQRGPLPGRYSPLLGQVAWW